MGEVTEFGLRLPAALYALGSVLITMLFVRRRFGLHGAILSGLLLLRSYQFLNQGRLGRVDMALTFFETLALFAFLAWLSERENDDPPSAPHSDLVGWCRSRYMVALPLGHFCRQARRGPMAKGAGESAEKVVKDLRRRTRRTFSAEEKIRIVLEGLRGEESIATLCRREGIVTNLYYRWSKEFQEAGKKQLQGDTRREG
jgi:hypothetical protein